MKREQGIFLAGIFLTIVLISITIVVKVNWDSSKTLIKEMTRKPAEIFWKKYEKEDASYFHVSIYYPSTWTFKENYGPGTSDLMVVFNNDRKQISVIFLVSANSFIEDFYNPQQRYLGFLQESIIDGKKAFIFDNKYNYKSAYYFPFKKGYYSLQLIDKHEEAIFNEMLRTVSIVE